MTIDAAADRERVKFEAHKSKLMWSVMLLVESLGGTAPMSAITAHCRGKGWTGQAPTIVMWLERAGRVTHDAESGTVFSASLTVEDDGGEDIPQNREDA